MYTNKKLEKYLKVSEKIKKLEKEREALRQEFILKGAGESRDFIVSVLHGVREFVAGKAEFETKFGESFLKDNGLLKLTNTTTVSVVEKKVKEQVA